MKKSLIILFLLITTPFVSRPMFKRAVCTNSRRNPTRINALALSSVILPQHIKQPIQCNLNAPPLRQTWRESLKETGQYTNKWYSTVKITNLTKCTSQEDWWNYFDKTLKELESSPNTLENILRISEFKHEKLKKIIKDELYYQDQRFEEYLKENPSETVQGLRYATSEEQITYLIRLIPIGYIPPCYDIEPIINYYGANKYVDEYIFKSLLPLKKGWDFLFSLSSQEQKEVIMKVISEYNEDVTVLQRIRYALRDIFADNTIGIAHTLLSYTFYENKVEAFRQLLDLRADPDQIIHRILNSKNNPYKLVFLRNILCYRPSVASFKYYLKLCPEKEFELFLDAQYNQDREFVKTVFELANYKQINMLCSAGIDEDLKQELLQSSFKQLKKTNSYDLNGLTPAIIISILKKHGARITQKEHDCYNAFLIGKAALIQTLQEV